MSTTYIVAYLALFFIVGLGFLFVNLLVGRFVRPKDPHDEKLDIYECGEPTIGSSFVQFDLRFYVVALLFLIFDVEVAFFFPWATVFGKATQMRDPALAADQAAYTANVTRLYGDMGVPAAAVPTDPEVIKQTAASLQWVSTLDILVFFAVLMVGFFYVWKRGDIDWVRAVSAERAQASGSLPTVEEEEREAVLSA